MSTARRDVVVRIGSRVMVVGAILVLAGVAAVLAIGIVLSGGSQPAQLTNTPRPTTEVIAMGNAHIPTTNACVLCHGAGGEVKFVPAMLHPVEGWRRCTTCHNDDSLGRKAPGHDGIAEEECLNCHKVAQSGPAITRPHSVLQTQGCLTCHGTFAHLPASMASADEDTCVLCHKAAELQPPAYPHEADNRLECSSCHRSPEVGGLPIDHARRTDDQCLLCHDVKYALPGPTLGPVPTLGPASSP
jgi:hypothetical protein